MRSLVQNIFWLLWETPKLSANQKFGPVWSDIVKIPQILARWSKLIQETNMKMQILWKSISKPPMVSTLKRELCSWTKLNLMNKLSQNRARDKNLVTTTLGNENLCQKRIESITIRKSRIFLRKLIGNSKLLLNL